MQILNQTTLANKIYSKNCPDCHKDNLENAAFCWNCNYEFPDKIAHSTENPHWWSSLFVQLVFIAAIVIIILIILDTVR